MTAAILAAFALLIAWTSLLALGIAVAYRGWRGRVVDRHPRCAACRYVLLGLRVRFAAAGCSCPECGADLGAPRAIRSGRRRAAPRQVSTGVVLAVIPLVALAVALPTLASIRARRAQAIVRPVAPATAPGTVARIGAIEVRTTGGGAAVVPIDVPHVHVTDAPDRPVLGRLDAFAPGPPASPEPHVVARDGFARHDGPVIEDVSSLAVPRE